MDKEKCCGNCKHFENEDTDGYGWCALQEQEVTCAYSYPCHEPLNNGWIEITPDNVDEVAQMIDRIVVSHYVDGTERKELISNIFPKDVLNIISNLGGYYYYVLPELKTDETE